MQNDAECVIVVVSMRTEPLHIRLTESVARVTKPRSPAMHYLCAGLV